jgi:14-3-3 protein epsilon
MEQPNLEGLSLHDEEEGFRLDFEEEEDENVDLRWCLIGRFLCERAIHFNSMKVRMADLWKPVKGVTIKEAPSGKFLFHFAHPLDMEAVLNGGPWSFDNNMLILERVQLGMQIEHIPLHSVNMWVQVHDLPMGLMKERNGIRMANYIGSFLEYDKNNNSTFWRQYMRIRVKIDVRRPLKKDTKVMNKEGEWCTVKFKYEKLGIFCFVCGIMGHGENKCEVRFSMEHDNGVREWSAEIRADSRRPGGRLASRWLREEKGGRSESDGGGAAGLANPMHGDEAVDPIGADVVQHNPIIPHNPLPNQQTIPIPINHMQAHNINSSTNNQSTQDRFTIPGPQTTFPSFNSHSESTQPLLQGDNLTFSSLLTATQNKTAFSNIHSQLINNQFLPITITQPETEILESQSLTTPLL